MLIDAKNDFNKLASAWFSMQNNEAGLMDL